MPLVGTGCGQISANWPSSSSLHSSAYNSAPEPCVPAKVQTTILEQL